MSQMYDADPRKNGDVVHEDIGLCSLNRDRGGLGNQYLAIWFGFAGQAGLAANRIGRLPQAAPEKAFTYAARQIFDARDSARMKDQKTLKAAGDFLAQTPFGVAVSTATIWSVFNMNMASMAGLRAATS